MQASQPPLTLKAAEAEVRRCSLALNVAKGKLRTAHTEYYQAAAALEIACQRVRELVPAQALQNVKSCAEANGGSRNATPPVKAR